MSFFYVECFEAVSVPGKFGIRTTSLKSKPQDTASGAGPAGDWFTFEPHPQGVVAMYRGDSAVATLVPWANLKCAHLRLAPAAPPVSTPTSSTGGAARGAKQ